MRGRGKRLAQEQWSELGRSLGLSQYEARAYFALIEFGDATAGEISKAARVPRGRVYGILEALQTKGLASITATTPQRYRPTALGAYLEQRKRELKEKEQELGRTAEALARIPLRRRATPISTGDFLLYRKRGAVMAKIRAMLEAATREILVMASEGWALRTSKILATGIREKSETGVEIRSCVNITANNLTAVKALRPYVRIRHNTLSNQVMTIAVVDEAQVLVCHWNPDDDSPFFGDDAAVWSDDKGVVNAFHAIAVESWERGIEAEARIRELESGEPPGRTDFFTDIKQVEAALVSAARSATKELRSSTLNSLVEEQVPNFVAFFGAIPLKTLDVRLLIVHDGGLLDGARSLARLGVKVRILRTGALGQHLVVDHAQALSFLWPGSEWTTSGEPGPHRRRLQDILISTTVRSAVDALVSAHDYEWERATPLEDIVETKPPGSIPRVRKTGF